MAASDIKPTQSEFSENFSTGGTVTGLKEDLINGKNPLDVLPIRIFTDETGQVRSVDNRRLVAAQQAGGSIATVPLTQFEKSQKTRVGINARNGRPDIAVRKKK